MNVLFCTIYFFVYLAGVKKVATTACVPFTVPITNGKRKSTEQTCVFTLYLSNCCPIVTLYSLVPRHTPMASRLFQNCRSKNCVVRGSRIDSIVFGIDSIVTKIDSIVINRRD